MNKKYNSGFALVIILILVVLAVVGYFGYKPYWPKLQTSNWKTYTNKKYGFEFKYPVFAQALVDSGNANFVNADNQADVVYLKLNNSDPNSSVYLIIFPHHSFDPKIIQYSDLKDYVTRTYNIKGQESIDPSNNRYRILLFNEYLIGNKPAIKLRTQAEPNQGIDTSEIGEIVYIEVGHGNIMTITVIDSQGSNDSEFDQILSTLKFIE